METAETYLKSDLNQDIIKYFKTAIADMKKPSTEDLEKFVENLKPVYPDLTLSLVRKKVMDKIRYKKRKGKK